MQKGLKQAQQSKIFGKVHTLSIAKLGINFLHSVSRVGNGEKVKGPQTITSCTHARNQKPSSFWDPPETEFRGQMMNDLSVLKVSGH